MDAKEFLAFGLANNNLIIDANDGYQDVVSGQIMKIEGETAEIWWYTVDEGIKGRGVERCDVNDFLDNRNPFYVIKSNRTYARDLDMELQVKLRNWHLVNNELYAAHGKRLKLSDFVSAVSRLLDLTEDLASVVVKMNIAINSIEYRKLYAGEFIYLSEQTREREDKRRYLSTISDEIQESSRRIDYVIPHTQTVGNYRERLFTSVLRKYIPKKFHVATGFIEGSSKQIDVIIYDQHNYIPLFREDDLVVVKKESVAAVIEIKTTLEQNALLDALEGIEKINEAGMASIPFFKGIFAFSGSLPNKTLASNVVTFYKNNPIESVHGHVDAICVPKKNSLYVDYDNLENDDLSRPVLYEVEDSKGVAVGEYIFFHRLFSFLEVDTSAKEINNEYFNDLSSMIDHTYVDLLTEEDWEPLYNFFSENRLTAHLDMSNDSEEIMRIHRDSVKRRVLDVKKWIEGGMPRKELSEKYNNYMY